METTFVIPIETGYIKPNENLNSIINPAKEIMEDGDYLVIAETPISVSQGRLVDESKYKPSLKVNFFNGLEQIFMGICLRTSFRN